MKKRFAVFLLALACLTLLAGCAVQPGPGAQEPEQEPDTGGQTLTRAIGEHQTVVYRFHAEPTAPIFEEQTISLALFDKDVESFNQAGNWATTWVGGRGLGKSSQTFRTEHAPGTPTETQWNSMSFFGSGTPKHRKVEGTDMTLTFTRSGENVRAVLEVDGVKAWGGEQTIWNMGDGTVYLYLYLKSCTLSHIQFQDMGSTGIVLPNWLQPLLLVGLLVVAFALHTLAKKAENKYYLYIYGGSPFLAAGLSICSAALILVLWGHSQPDILLQLSGGYISIPLQAEGPGFWVPAVVSGLGAVCFFIYAVSQATPLCLKFISRLLTAFPLGLIHAAWYAAVVFAILASLNAIFQLIMSVVCIVALFFVGKAFLESDKKPHAEVLTTTRIYNSIGNLVDAKFNIDYVELPEDKQKK